MAPGGECTPLGRDLGARETPSSQYGRWGSSIERHRLEAVTMSTPTPSGHRAIENLIAKYAELVDGGDFSGVGTLLADATFTGGAGSVTGRDAIERMLQDGLIVYDDGTP